MNSTKLHSLSLSLAGRRQEKTTLGGFGLQRWRARRRIKEGEKSGGDFSKAGAADRESNVEHMQTAASSNGGENWRGLRGLATERKRIEDGQLGRRTAAEDGPKDSDFWLA